MSISGLEALAFVLGVAMVLCNLRLNPWGWPLAIASSVLYIAVFVEARLYGQAGLQGFFIAVSIWGWHQWLRGTDAQGRTLAVGRLNARHRGLAALVTLAAWPLLAMLLVSSTDGAWPWLDALPAVASITAQVLLARKRWETWPLWLGINVCSAALFAFQGLWLTVLLYAVFAALSVAGWRAWARHLSPAGQGETTQALVQTREAQPEPNP